MNTTNRAALSSRVATWLAAMVSLLVGGALSSEARVYDFRKEFYIEGWEIPTVSGPYEDLLISVTDTDTSFPLPSAGTSTNSGTLSFSGSGWSYSSPTVLLTIAKTNGATFTPNSVRLLYRTYSPHDVPGTYQSGTIAIRAYSGSTQVGIYTNFYNGANNAAGLDVDVDFSAVSGFANITSMVFDGDRQALSLQNLVMDAVANTAPAFVGGTLTLSVNQDSGATSIKDLLHVADTNSSQTLTWTQSVAPLHGSLAFAGATASSGGGDIAPGGTITYTPAAGYSGSDSFTVQVGDGIATATRTIIVTVADTAAPTIAIGSPSGSVTGPGPISFNVAYSDLNFSSSTLNASHVTVNSTGTATAGSVQVTGSGTNRTVTLSSITGDGTLGISIASGTGSDGTGNLAAGAGPSATFTVDNTAPTVSIGSPSVALTRSGPVTFTVTYADAALASVGLLANQVTVNSTGTAVAGSIGVSGSGNTRTVTLSSLTGDGTLGISLASGTAADTAGNAAPAAGPSGTFSADNTLPVISSIVRKTPVTQTVGTNVVVFAVTFSEPVSNVGTGLFSVTTVNGATTAATVTGLGGGPQVYDVAVTISSGAGEFRLDAAQ